MRQNLLETYARQLKVAEAYVAKNYEGKTMSSNTALTTAVLLDNTNRADGYARKRGPLLRRDHRSRYGRGSPRGRKGRIGIHLAR